MLAWPIWLEFSREFSYKEVTNQPKEITMVFGKSKDNEVAETSTDQLPNDDDTTKVLAPEAPMELMQALEAIQHETDIFKTRVQTLMDNIMKNAPKSAVKNSFSHAKHAAMCVRDVYKEFGRKTL
jgi:hypothetical protein